jgi:hypothetical protein
MKRILLSNSFFFRLEILLSERVEKKEKIWYTLSPVHLEIFLLSSYLIFSYVSKLSLEREKKIKDILIFFSLNNIIQIINK